MKTLYSIANGAITITEQSGIISLNVDDSLNVGGGPAAGIISIQGKGSVALNAFQGLKLAEALLNAHIPATILPIVEAGESIAETAIKSVE